MPVSAETRSGVQWQRMASGGYGLFSSSKGTTARRIIVEGAGNLYLIPVGSTTAAGTLFFTGVTAGMQFDQQCDGIGTDTTCSAVIAQF
jgi:hypothetical protein